MKTLFLLALVSLLSVSCTVTPSTVTINGITATSSKRLGGKQMIYAKNGDTVVALVDNNEKSFRDGAGVVKWGIAGWTLADITGSVTSGLTSVRNTEAAAEVSKVGLKEATTQVGLKEATAQQALKLEEAAMMMGQ